MNLQSSQTVVSSRGLENQDRALPAMTVVLVTPDRFESLRKTIRHLQVQTVHDRLEILIVAPSRKNLDLDQSELAGFFCYNVTEANVCGSVSAAKAAAIH